MSKQWQIRRGTTIANDDFTGAVGELTMDTDKNQLRLHDGSTQGGHAFGDTVIEYQMPSADNNYTWYRKYASGWVEQGGHTTASASATNNSVIVSISLLVEMSDINYTALGNANFSGGTAWNGPVKTGDSTTTVVKFGGWISGTGTMTMQEWQVSGMAA